MFYRSQSPLEQAHMASALVFELSKVETPHDARGGGPSCSMWMLNWLQRVADGLACRRCPGPTRCRAGARPAVSPALRIIDRMKPTLQAAASASWWLMA